MAVTVQRGTKTLPAASASMTIVRGTDPGFDTTVVKDRTLLRATARTPGTSINVWTNYAISRDLTNGDTITIERSGTDADVIVDWELIQFDPGQFVAQYVTLTLTATLGDTEAIAAASLGGGRWIEDLGMVSAQEAASRSTYNLRFDSTTVVSATRANATGTIVIKAVVCEHVAATVQTIEETLTTNVETDHDAVISAVTLATAFAVGTVRCAGSGSPPDSGWQARLFDETHFRMTRQTGTSLTFTHTSFVVSFADGTTVQRFTVTHTDGGAAVNTALSAVTLARSSVLQSGMFARGVGQTTSTVWGRALSTQTLTTTTNLLTTKGVTTTAMVSYPQVMEFASVGVPPLDDYLLVLAGRRRR